MPLEESRIEVPSRWGRPATYPYRRHTEGASRLAVLFPGYAYPLEAPLLWYAARAAAGAGCDVLGVEYGFQANRVAMPQQELPQLVDEVAGALDRFLAEHPYAACVIIAKSIGTATATRLAEAGHLPAAAGFVYLTPLRGTIAFMQQAKRMAVVVGDQDPLFGAADIEKIAGLPDLDLHVVPGADHLLEVEGDPAPSLAALSETAAVCRAACTEA